MQFTTVILAALISLASATEISKLNVEHLAQITKKDACSGVCQDVGNELLQCFPDYPDYEITEVSKCVCGLDDSFFPKFTNCVQNCDQFQFGGLGQSQLDDPKDVKQTFCNLAGADSGDDSEEDSPAVTTYSNGNHTDSPTHFTNVSNNTQPATTTATKSKNGATALGASFAVLVGIALL
ncbi:uncharacterized protein SPAPADRAFT_62848 [Spathaspora passalidarum NRRL Y-27907]|uniref:Extracellular membrane protein CFEM domain-containing protein n=1 Tax=Spathaspora passalidarum (strain NRRL Y-27907 / 11-Y1) TaxID=619300 RepID=G3ATH3_SPAPN|nr:uncharacterized protein SPAPADRAFT_62848 [Spathaspora passalidarum NRRL Y-27907]EGW30936.1 hypothetical protein SPAPADRAFT_62848 [Spathaspora passalidarum NRRL Y-27907]